MCICGGVLEIMVVTAVVTACSKCSKKEEKLTSLKLSSNECGQSSNKVPGWTGPEKGKEKAFLLLCPYCEDGTLDKDCGDCHNVYAETGRPDRCSEPDVDSCYDCEWDDTPYAGRKLREGEMSWAEKCAALKAKDKAEAQILEKVGEETIKDYPCMHEQTTFVVNEYGRKQEKCQCGQWLAGMEEEETTYISPEPPVHQAYVSPCKDKSVEEAISEGLPTFPPTQFQFPKHDDGPGFYTFPDSPVVPKDDATWGPGEGKDPTPVQCRYNDLSCADCSLPGSDETERPCRWEGPYRQNREDVK